MPCNYVMRNDDIPLTNGNIIVWENMYTDLAPYHVVHLCYNLVQNCFLESPIFHFKVILFLSITIPLIHRFVLVCFVRLTF